MILDKRLKLAENLDIVAGRNISGIKQSDLFPVLSLGEIGRGEPLFLCVTVRETFSVPAGDRVYIKMSLREELFAYTGFIDSEVAPLSGPLARHYHNKNPIIASSGYIELAPSTASGNDAANNNFVAGKKYTFAINPYSGSIKSATVGPGFAPTGVVRFQGGTYAYFLLEEFTSTEAQDAFFAADEIASGKIDVEIVSLADSGASASFSDVKSYPTRTIVR